VASFSHDKKTQKPLTYTLMANGHQMAILLLYNDPSVDSLTVAEIEKQLGTPITLCRCTLNSAMLGIAHWDVVGTPSSLYRWKPV
jgi:hypothetical protein